MRERENFFFDNVPLSFIIVWVLLYDEVTIE
jgi:hypothetical protein